MISSNSKESIKDTVIIIMEISCLQMLVYKECYVQGTAMRIITKTIYPL